jgi:hypothetical protein
MTSGQAPLPPTPPSSARLLRSTLIALGVATVILFVAVLPAEYGIDPTGVGRVLGLTKMGEIKMTLAREAAAEHAADDSAAAVVVPAAAVTPGADTGWRDVTVVPLAPGEGKEVKLEMGKGAKATFEWIVSGGVVNHDTHGDSTGAPKSYINYKKGAGVSRDSGELVALMDGSHGWFWRNRTKAPVEITLRTKGQYAKLKRMY